MEEGTYTTCGMHQNVTLLPKGMACAGCSMEAPWHYHTNERNQAPEGSSDHVCEIARKGN